MRMIGSATLSIPKLIGQGDEQQRRRRAPFMAWVRVLISLMKQVCVVRWVVQQESTRSLAVGGELRKPVGGKAAA